MVNDEEFTATASAIEWKEEKNVTVKVIKKK